jgi:membrane protein DedA with SNARE-associated domain
MGGLILKYISVILISAVKFIGGPVLGIAYGLTIVETALATILGMMISVYSLSYFGNWFRQKFMKVFASKQKKLTKNKKVKAVWEKYGIKGIAFLTPIIFSPMIGTILALSFGGKRKRVVFYMFISALFWGFVLSSIVFFFGDIL